jgi:hypothetical protein
MIYWRADRRVHEEAVGCRFHHTHDEEPLMRFMIMHKNDPNTEAGKPPPMEIVHEMGAFIGAHARAGRYIAGAGLGGSTTRTRLVFRNGQCTTKRGPYRGEHELPAATLLQPSSRGQRLVFSNNDLQMTDGPFVESKELIGGFAVLELPGMDEAIEQCRQYARISRGTLELDRRLVEDDGAE